MANSESITDGQGGSSAPATNAVGYVTSAFQRATLGPRRLWAGLRQAAGRPARERRIKASLEYLAALKDRHRGQRGFVIGNGPSLRLDDLERIGAEVSIASNKIYLAFDNVRWRPSYYTVVDNLVWEKVYNFLPAHKLQPIITSLLPDKPIPHHVVRHLGNATRDGLEAGADRFSQDLTKGYYSGYSVTFENLQLAWHLGLDPIILIGCDHYYAGEEDRKSDFRPIRNQSMNNHFLPKYRDPGEKVNPAPIAGMTIAYEIAAQYAKRQGRSILNATRGGHLEAFPRADLDSLLVPP